MNKASNWFPHRSWYPTPEEKLANEVSRLRMALERAQKAPQHPSEQAKTIGERIEALQKECGWSFDVLADKTGLDKKLIIGHMRHGKGVTSRTLKMYADAFSRELKRKISVTDIEG